MGTYYSPNHRIPAPDDQDLITNGPHQFKAMVDRVDALMQQQILTWGNLKVRAGSAVIGHVGYGQYVVTLPTGWAGFTAPPTIVVTNGDFVANPGLMEITSPGLVTTTQFQVTCVPSPTAPTFTPGPGHLLRCNWIAIGA